MKKGHLIILNEDFAHIWLLVLRISVAALMLSHGWPKIEKLLAGGEIKFANPLGIGETVSLVMAVFAEVICSILVAIGYKVRWAVIPLIFTMIVAVVVVHADDPFKNKEMALLYLIVYLGLIVFGGGKYALDRVIHKK
jgi:putative oxidoreductase